MEVPLENVTERGNHRPRLCVLRPRIRGPITQVLSLRSHAYTVFLGTFRPVTSHAKKKLAANIEAAGGVAPSSHILIYPVDGEVLDAEDVGNHKYRSVDGNTRCVVLQEK